MKKHLLLAFFLSLFFLTFAFLFPVSAQLISSLDDYCIDSSGSALGYYLADGGKACGRAPYCAGKTLQEAAAIDFKSVAQCWDNRCDWGMCAGQVPLCCYEVERTGDGNYCPFPERAYCQKTQCDKIPADKRSSCLGSDFQTLVDCQCGNAINHWCSTECGKQADGSDIPYVPLSSRVNISPTPTPPGHRCLGMAKAGDYNCTGGVDEADFFAWKTDFLQNKSTLSFFEYWRRAAY